MQTSGQPKDKLTLKTCDGFIFPDRSEIVRFEGGHNFILVFIVNQENPVRLPLTLSCIELQYPFPEFFRCHKSHIVNLTHIIKYEKKSRNLFTTSGFVVLADNKVEEFEIKMGLS